MTAYRRLAVSTWVLADVLHLPPGATIVAAGPGTAGTVEFLVADDSFTPVPEGEVTPLVSLVATRIESHWGDS